MFDYKYENFINESLRIWNEKGIKEGILNIFNYEAEELNVTQTYQIIAELLRKSNVVRYNSIDLRELISNYLMHKRNVTGLLSYMPNPDGKNLELVSSWKEKMEDTLDKIVTEIKNIINNYNSKENIDNNEIVIGESKPIENMKDLSVEEFVEFLFDREKNLVSSEIIVDQLDKYLSANKLSLLLNSEITNDLIYEIISLKDRITMNVLTMGIEKQLNDKLEAYILTIKEELNSAVARKQLFDKEEKFTEDVLKVYNEEGLRSAIKYLFSEGLDVSIYKIFDNVLYRIYLKNNISYEKHPYFNRIIEDVMNHVKNIRSIIESSNGEISKENKEKLIIEERKFNNCITRLVDEIIKDFNVNRININLPLDVFVTRLFEVGYHDRTVNGIYNQIYNYFQHRNIKLDENNDFKTLIKAILDFEDSYYISSPLQEFKNKDEKDTKKVKNKIDGLINILRTYTGLQDEKYLSSVLDKRAERIKQYYDKMEKITKENNDIYIEINQLKMRVELNEDKKRQLTEEFRREEGISKK